MRPTKQNWFAPMLIAGALTLGGVSGVAATATEVAAAATNSCVQWGVAGTWNEVQSDGTAATLTFVQDGTKLTGNVLVPQAEAIKFDYQGVKGRLTGTLDGDKLAFSIQWPLLPNEHVTTTEFAATVVTGGVRAATVSQDLGAGASGTGGTWKGTGPTQCFASVAAAIAGEQPTKPSSSTGEIAGIVIGALVVIGLAIAGLMYRRDKNRPEEESAMPVMPSAVLENITTDTAPKRSRFTRQR